MNDAAALLALMLAIPSPSGGEGPLAAFLAGRLSEMGFDAAVDSVGNLVAEIGDRPRPRVLLLGHLDTVPGDIRVRGEDGRLFGRGAVDAKGPLAAMICAAATAGFPGRLVVAGAVEEEVPASTGAHHLINSQPAPDAVLVAEPTGWTGICVGYKGRVGLEYSVSRPATHSSSPEEKAVEVAAELWLQVREHLAGLHDGPGLFGRATATLTRLEGDMERARARITCRVPPGFDFDAFDAHLRGIARGGRLVVDERTPAVRADQRSPVVRALAAAIRARGERPTLKLKTGTADMNLVAAAWPCPVAAYGPGDSRLDHTAGEHVEVAELALGVEVLREALAALAAELIQSEAPPPAALPVAADDDDAIVTARLRALGYLE
jgi:LysW-gamma-L-lysine carboxypeptidase